MTALTSNEQMVPMLWLIAIMDALCFHHKP